MSSLLFVVFGFLVGLSFRGGVFLLAIPFALVSLVLAWLNRPVYPESSDESSSGAIPVLRSGRTTDKTAFGKILRPAITQTGPTLATKDMFGAYPGDGEASFNKLNGNEIWTKLERDLDSVYNSSLGALRNLIPGAHSVLLLLKSDRKSFRVRAFASEAENEINRNALISDGSGVVGQLAGRELARILEGDLPNGKSLGYYAVNVAVHSVAGVPILNEKKERVGALIVDSLERNAFRSDQIPSLESFAALFYMLTYKSYTSASNYREKKKFYELSAYQQRFFKTTLLRDTYKEIFEYVSQNFVAERIMILVFHPEKDEGMVAFCRGEDEERFEGMKFSLSDKGILPLAMMQHCAMERVFNGRSEYVPRITDQEPRNNSLRYLFVQPSSMTMHNAALNEPSEIAICLERRYAQHFDQLEKDLLRFMVNIAYFAYQRGMQFEHEQFEIYHDALTGLLNRRTINEEIVKLDKSRGEKNIGVMMMDIDHFKHINDTYGHQAGDAVLKEIASRISSVAAVDGNLLARYGGEEFFVAVPDATEVSLMAVAERIRLAVCTAPFDIFQGAPIDVSVSIGCFLVTGEFHGDMSRAVQYADEALYSAKENGRNRVVRYENRAFDLEPDEKEMV